MLEWVTAEEAEKMAKKDIKSYYINMAPNIILGILGILYIFINAKNPFSAFNICNIITMVNSTSNYVLYK